MMPLEFIVEYGKPEYGMLVNNFSMSNIFYFIRSQH